MLLLGQAHCDTGVVFGLDDSPFSARSSFLAKLKLSHGLDAYQRSAPRWPPINALGEGITIDLVARGTSGKWFKDAKGSNLAASVPDDAKTCNFHIRSIGVGTIEVCLDLGAKPTCAALKDLMNALSSSAWGLTENYDERHSPLRDDILALCSVVQRHAREIFGDAKILRREPRLREAIEGFNWMLIPSLEEAGKGQFSGQEAALREEFKSIENARTGFKHELLEIDEAVSADFGWYLTLVHLSTDSVELDQQTIPRAFETAASYATAATAMTQLCTSKLGEWAAGREPGELEALRLRGLAAGLVSATEYSGAAESAGLLEFFRYYEEFANLKSLREGLGHGVEALAAVVGTATAVRRGQQERALVLWGLGLAALATLSVAADVFGEVAFSSFPSWEWGRRAFYMSTACALIVGLLYLQARAKGT